MNLVKIYNYYYIKLNGKNYVYKRCMLVEDIACAHKFTTKMQAASYARKYLGDKDFSIIGGGGIKETPLYEY